MDERDQIDHDALRMVGTMLRFVRIADQNLRQHCNGDLGLTDLSVLANIARGVEQPSTLADTLNVDRPRITRVTDRLAQLGYVRRTNDIEDRRRSLLSLTESGKSALYEGQTALSRTVDALLDHLDPVTRRSLIHGLQVIRPILDDLARSNRQRAEDDASP